MARERKGYTYQEEGRWYARLTHTDERGKRRNIKRRAETKTHAKEILKQLQREIEDHGGQSLDSAQMTFKELADYYEKTYLIPPEYVDGRKVAGLRAWNKFRPLLSVLKEHFGNRRIRTINFGDLDRFRATRLKTPTKKGTQRAIATVNRELSLLRRVFHVALRNGWIIKNPFETGESLIRPGDEKPRERIISREEEERLLAACTGKRAHLRAIIICALDTGMRAGEILKLRWSDIDFENRLIIVRGLNTKTLRERQLAMTERLAIELMKLFEQSPKDSDRLVFGIKDNFKNSFNAARADAHLPDVRFHDLRHTHATRLVSAHIPLSEVGRVLGHTQANTTYRYVNANVETARRAASVIDEFNKATETRESEEVVIN